MSCEIQRLNGQNMEVNSYVQGAQILTPYAYFGNAQAKAINSGARGPYQDAFNTSSVADDQQPPIDEPIGTRPEYGYPDPFAEGTQCLKRFQIEVAHPKTPAPADEEDSEGIPTLLVPSKGAPARALEETMWGLQAGTRIKDNFLLNFDTLQLYEAAGDTTELGRVGNSSYYTSGAFPGRGLPIRFQKVYFYGTRGQISGSTPIDADQPFNSRTQSDGRGALFSTYILCADAAVNVLHPSGGTDGVGYSPTELESYGLAGGTFSYLGSGSGNYDDGSDFFMSGRTEYDQGIDVPMAPSPFGTDSPLVIGDGALGFREQSLGRDLFGEVDVYSVYEADKYYHQEITLCINGEERKGKILFQPDDASPYPASDKKMVAHDIRNNFSCTSIMPKDTCECCDPVLPYQHEKVYIVDDSTFLVRTSPDALNNVSSVDKCGTTCTTTTPAP